MNKALAAICTGVALLSGCASTGDRFGRSDPVYDAGPVNGSPGVGAARSDVAGPRYGQVETIRELQRDGRGNWLPGALLGSVVGGVLGNQIGSGRGNDVATIAGAVGGAVVGGQVGSRATQTERAFEVEVRLDDGQRVLLHQPDVSDLQPNMRVVVEGGRVRRY